MGDLSRNGCGCGCDNGCGNGLFGGSSCCSPDLDHPAALLLAAATAADSFGNSGCGCDNGCGGSDSCLWIILLLLFCGNGFWRKPPADAIPADAKIATRAALTGQPAMKNRYRKPHDFRRPFIY